MNQFKVGDRVQRVERDFDGEIIKRAGIGTVLKITKNNIRVRWESGSKSLCEKYQLTIIGGAR